jgi:pilus assembly protein Flp/PilA
MVCMSLQTDRRGVAAIEYGLIASLIAGVIVGATAFVGTRLPAAFEGGGRIFHTVWCGTHPYQKDLL